MGRGAYTGWVAWRGGRDGGTAGKHGLMQAVKASGIAARTVNAAFPDAVNPILARVGLAPDIGEAILEGRQPADLGVHVLREGFPVEWGEQRGMMVTR